MRLLLTDDDFTYRKHEKSDKCSINAINRVHSNNLNNERFLGIAPTEADAQRTIEYLLLASDNLKLAYAAMGRN
jgi:hypothetical protein